MSQNFYRNRRRRGHGGQNNGGQNRPRFANQQTPHQKYINQASPVEEQEAYAPQHKFTEFGLEQRVVNNVHNKGYTTPTPIQDQAIDPVMAGHDVVGIANTGTGKTAAFLLPLITKCLQDRRNRVLIMAPTRELAVQIEEELRTFARGTDVYGTLCIGGASINNQIANLRRQPTMIIGTPGRLKDLIEQRQLRMDQFTHVVLDEVDRMVDIGFLRDIKYLLSLLPKQRQSLFFSATVTNDVRTIMDQFLQSPVTISVKTHETAQTVEQDIIKVSDPNQKFDKLIDLLHQEDFNKVIVFCRTKWGAEKLAKNLVKSGFRSAAIHGNKSQSQRQRALTDFKQERIHILVATDVAARGLDIPNVSHVINYDEPGTYEDYVHRIGRTGRAEKRGKALTFVQ